jgi:hypothetical protein
MATISGYDSSSIGVLFSSLNSGSTKTSAMFGTSDLLGINYSDYATIKNGSYTKLMKAYYAKEASGDSSSSSITSTSTSKDSSKTLANIESAADDLKKASEALRTNGDKSLFTKKQTTDKDGNVSYEYDTDKIYKAVSDFVDSYNKMLKEGGDSNTNSILRSTKSMVNLTKANSNMLSSVGITIGTDNKLSIDETAFKKANMNTVKSLFHTTGGFGYQTSVQAGMIESYAKSEAEKANTYNKSGMYTYNYTTGEIYNTTT